MGEFVSGRRAYAAAAIAAVAITAAWSPSGVVSIAG